MTAQISDEVRYRRRVFRLAGVSGSGLFTPREHGLEPVATSSACWRGFVCRYWVSSETLTLRQLWLGLAPEQLESAKAGQGPALFGARPRYAPSSPRGPIVYSRLTARTPFTGGLLLADRFVHGLYVHMGFPPAWKFEEVHELIFEEGRLLKEVDCSAAMARVRELLARQPLRPGYSAPAEEVAGWIAKTFSLDYR